MAYQEHLQIIRQGVKAWNQWTAYSKMRPDLSNANLSGAELNNVNLSGANLSSTSLILANRSGADLSGANLTALT